MKVQKIEISTSTILKSVLILVGLYLMWELRGVFFMLFFSFILYSSFRPIVDRLEKRHIPRGVSIAGLYLTLFIIISIIMVVGANALIDQVKNLSSDIEGIFVSFLQTLEKVFPWLEGNIDYDKITENDTGKELANSLMSTENLNSAFGILSSLGSAALAVFVVIMISVYMLARKERFYNGLFDVFFGKYKKDLSQLMQKVETGLGSWFIGQILLMVIVGFLTWIAVSLPGLFFDWYTVDDYAIPIALIAGLLEAVPNIGPTVTVVIASVIAIGSGDVATAETTFTTLLQAGYMVAAGIVIQNLEAVFIFPGVMKKAVGVDPIITILGIIAALSLFGIVGAILVIPIVATVQIIIEFYRTKKA